MFDLFVSQPGHDDLTQGQYFYCPLCRNGPFLREAAVGANPRLTLAHIIPESLGGGWTTLACADCNNGNGHRIEADLLAQHKFTDWVHGRGPLKVRMGEKRKVRAEATHEPQSKELAFKITTPEESLAVQDFRRRFKAASSREFPFAIPWFRPEACWAAVCQSAYLLMFRWFGYDFARNPRYNFIRDQVFQTDQKFIGEILDLPPDVSAQFLDGNQAAVIFTREPTKSILAVMQFRSPGARDQVLAVSMPGPDEESLSTVELEGMVYASVAESQESLINGEGSFVLAWRQFLNS